MPNKHHVAQKKHFRSRFDRIDTANGRRAPTQVPERLMAPNHLLLVAFLSIRERQGSKMPNKSAILGCVSNASEIRRVGEPQLRAEIEVDPNRNRPFCTTFRLNRKHQWSKMPTKGRESKSPRIGHFVRRFDRIGNTNGRRAPKKKGPGRRRAESFDRYGNTKNRRAPTPRAKIDGAPNLPVSIDS